MSKPNADYLECLHFDRTLKEGTACVVHWTSGGRYHHCAGKVSKLNPKSVRVKLDRDVRVFRHEGGDYKAGQEIIVPRVLNFKQWTWNNCVTPDELPSGKVPDGVNNAPAGYGTVRHDQLPKCECGRTMQYDAGHPDSRDEPGQAPAWFCECGLTRSVTPAEMTATP